MGQVKQDWTVHSVYTLLVHFILFEIFRNCILYSRNICSIPDHYMHFISEYSLTTTSIPGMFYFRIFVNHDIDFSNRIC